MLRTVLDSNLSISISDAQRPDRPLIWVNAAFTRLTGYPLDEAVGRNCRFLQGAGTDPRTVARIRTELDAGRTIATVVRNYHRDGTPFWNQIVITPVTDDTGLVTHLVGIQARFTDQLPPEHVHDLEDGFDARASARLDLLARVSDELARNLDYDAAADALGDITIPALATWGFVAMTDERGRFSRIHLVVADPARRDLARLLEEEDVSWLSRSPKVTEALASSPGYVATPFPVDTDGLPGRTSPAQLDLLRHLGLGSSMVVPLRARDRVIGVLCLVHEDEFDAGAVVTAAHLGRRAGLALDNVRLLLAERSAALTLQQSLLPTITDVPGLDVATAYVPSGRRAQVGGDWFDVLPLPDGTVGLAVGDVVGHDLRAAAAMGELRGVLRSYAWEGLGPAEVVDRCNDVIKGLGMAAMATAVYARLERGDGGGWTMRYANAGHPPPLLRRADGRVELLTGNLSPMIGATREVPREETVVVCGAGDVFLLHTDGLIEAPGTDPDERTQLIADTLAAQPSDIPVEELCDRLLGVLGVDGLRDDAVLLAIRIDAADGPAAA